MDDNNQDNIKIPKGMERVAELIEKGKLFEQLEREQASKEKAKDETKTKQDTKKNFFENVLGEKPKKESK